MDSTQFEVVQIISRVTKVPPASILPDTDLRLDLNVDSLQGLQIVAALEKHFNVTVPDDELDNYDSVHLIVSTIERLRGSP